MWRETARECFELAQDGAVWLTGVLMLGVAHVLVDYIALPPALMGMMESLHLNAVYATILVASAGAVSRLLVRALERLGHWN
jgi:hypothetical protein